MVCYIFVLKIGLSNSIGIHHHREILQCRELAEGADVKVSEIKVGSIPKVNIDPETYLTEVTMVIDEKIKLPLDTMAVVSAESLLGGNYMRLDPVGEEDLVGPGGRLYLHSRRSRYHRTFSQMIYSPRENN